MLKSPPKPCVRCEVEPRPSGQGQRYCVTCASVVVEENRIKSHDRIKAKRAASATYGAPCILCGGRKAPGRARRTCLECQPLVRAAYEQRKHPPCVERRCRRCRVTKPIGAYDLIPDGVALAPKASPHFKNCRECRASQTLPKPCVVCGDPKAPGRGRKYCAECASDPEAVAPEPRTFQCITKFLRHQTWDKSGGVCGVCSFKIDPEENWEVDHIKPRARGGTNDLTNLQAAHSKCNRWKSDRWEELHAHE